MKANEEDRKQREERSDDQLEQTQINERYKGMKEAGNIDKSDD